VLQKRQLYVLKGRNRKLTAENAIFTQTDKGKIIVIINSNEYSKKANSCLSVNNSKTLTKDPTDKFQKSVHKAMQDCNLIIDKRRIKHLTQKSPLHPTSKPN
jgi:hypothetical protein